MADELYALNAKERLIFLELVKDYRERRVQGPGGGRPELEDYPSTDCYIARTPTGGIPALDDHLPGTAVDTDPTDDEPGYAACDIYRIVLVDDVYALQSMETEKLVFNLSQTAVDGDAWVGIVKEKSGHWIVAGAGGAGGSGSGSGVTNYLVLTPAGGIPALTYGANVGTSTIAALDDVPGYADCRVYKIVHTGLNPTVIYQGFSIRVYNTMELLIPGGRWVTAIRDTYGLWAVPNNGLDYGQC